MSYSSYINDIEDNNIEACIEHRKSLNLPDIQDIYSIECSEEPCEKGCPHNE